LGPNGFFIHQRLSSGSLFLLPPNSRLNFLLCRAASVG
jgi:hypothetical protein